MMVSLLPFFSSSLSGEFLMTYLGAGRIHNRGSHRPFGLLLHVYEACFSALEFFNWLDDNRTGDINHDVENSLELASGKG